MLNAERMWPMGQVTVQSTPEMKCQCTERLHCQSLCPHVVNTHHTCWSTADPDQLKYRGLIITSTVYISGFIPCIAAHL